MKGPLKQTSMLWLIILAICMTLAQELDWGFMALLPVMVLVPKMFSKSGTGLLVILLTLGVLPPVPREVSWREICFVVAFGTTMTGWAKRFVLGQVMLPRSTLIVSLMAFWGLSLFSVLPAAAGDVTVSNWVRGVIPFLTFPILFVALTDLASYEQRQEVMVAMLLSAGIIAVEIFSQVPGNWISHEKVKHWISLRVALPPNVFQPVMLAACGYCLGQCILPANEIRLRYLLIFVTMVVAVALTFLRSMILILAVVAFCVAILHLVINFKRMGTLAGRIIKIIPVMAVIFALSLLIPQVANFYALVVKTFLMRFSDSEYTFFQSGRYLEWIAILDVLGNDPLRLLFGMGLGAKFEFYHLYLEKTLHYGYTHCILSYILLTTGFVGIAVFGAAAAIVTDTILKLQKTLRLRERPMFYGMATALGCIFCYALMQSIFRHFSFNILVALIFGTMANMDRYGAVGKEETKVQCVASLE